MKLVSYYLPSYSNNEIFDISNKKINRDDYAYSHYLLRSLALEKGVNISTADINSVFSSNLLICHDLISEPDVARVSCNKWIFLFESEVISPLNWCDSKLRFFDKVFTWNDDLVDNKKYFKFNFSHKFPENIERYRKGFREFSEKKLCTLISGNKSVTHPFELYSQRVKSIRWFEKNHPEDFDLYGIGWDRWTFSNRYLKFLSSKLPSLFSWFTPKFPSYKGPVESKKGVLSNYKFAICYENAQLIPGYITEKIFDCFFAGCVPVYWGAPNITDHIPKGCFIDRRDFETHEELYNYLVNMSEVTYLEYQSNIKDFIFSSKADPFRAETFADTIVEHILDDIK